MRNFVLAALPILAAFAPDAALQAGEPHIAYLAVPLDQLGVAVGNAGDDTGQRRDAAMPSGREFGSPSQSEDSTPPDAFGPIPTPPSPPAPSGYARKLLLTNGIASLEGASGGGIATWAVLAGMQETGIGGGGHATAVLLPDFDWQSFGVGVSYANRIELSFARQRFDTRDVGTALGLGRGFTFDQDVFGAKLRLFGDAVYGDPLLPQVSLGVQHKRNRDGNTVRAVGARHDSGTDITLSATKLLLAHSVLVGATARLTKANQTGLLGFGSASHPGYGLQFEGSLAYQFSRRMVIGAELRTKPDNLGLGEDDWMDLFVAYAPADFLTLTAAYADLGSIATFDDQRGAFLQAQVAF